MDKKEIFKRDGNKCRFCGNAENLELDHIIPLVKNGTNDLDNLQVLCKSCNVSKVGKILLNGYING